MSAMRPPKGLQWRKTLGEVEVRNELRLPLFRFLCLRTAWNALGAMPSGVPCHATSRVATCGACPSHAVLWRLARSEKALCRVYCPRGAVMTGALHADGQCGDGADGFDLVELDEGVAGEDGKRRDTKKTKDSHLPLSLMRGASMGYHLVFVSVKPKT